jgi:hypothetical protein
MQSLKDGIAGLMGSLCTVCGTGIRLWNDIGILRTSGLDSGLDLGKGGFSIR